MELIKKSVEILDNGKQREEVRNFLAGLKPEYADGLVELLRAQFRLQEVEEKDQQLAITLLALAGVALTAIADKPAEAVIADLKFLETKVLEASKELEAAGVDMNDLGAELRAAREAGYVGGSDNHTVH